MNRLPYDVTMSWGKESMARLAQGLILFGVQLTDSYTPNRAPQSREWVYLRVQVPEDRVEAFKEYVKPKEMNPAPEANVWEGVTLPRDPDQCVHLHTTMFVEGVARCFDCDKTIRDDRD